MITSIMAATTTFLWEKIRAKGWLSSPLLRFNVSCNERIFRTHIWDLAILDDEQSAKLKGDLEAIPRGLGISNSREFGASWASP